ncbi:potassium channel family protein [Terrihabitans rhizophilus]|jgi:voltage-gated potassium channel|uniref:Ion channel n=1 Tax=Terrihabitans rhizophilus TaxID=3092662 RepID=A0ABU4RM01_9HYPH|nr:ion channel [Terrihabitans sp. PJ23]MDX6805851.1 ion channel [Terrihabitans sp. PJ23]
MHSLRTRLRSLYYGHSLAAVRFQWTVMAIDLAIIVFFLATPLLSNRLIFYWIDYTAAAFVAADLVARGLAAREPIRWARRLDVWVDIFVLATLLAPLWLVNLSFLRILRLWTLSRTEIIWRPLRRSGWAEWESAARAVINLITFLFVTTGFVYTSFAGQVEGLNTYVDALYFTVATVTTTGFGDITLPGTWGKLTSIVAMIIGISLFVQLAQAIFRPRKVTFACPKCALMRHEPDAVHCKACGELLAIPNDGS